MKNRKLLLIVSLVLALTMSLGGTLAYLTDTDEAVNVMTLGNVKIEQYEKDAEGNTFEQNQPLYPAYYTTDKEGKITSAVTGAIDKVVSVKNVGDSEAYVRTLLAFEAGNLNYADFQKYIHTEFEMQAEWLQTPINVKGVNYYVACVDYDKLAAGIEGDASLLKVFMDKAATNEIVAQFGNTYEIVALSQAVQTKNMPNAEIAWQESFGEFKNDADTVERAAEWFKGVAVIPVTTVSTAAELTDALAKGGTVVLGADLELNDVPLTIKKDQAATIDLNGHTLSGLYTAETTTYLIKVEQGATLTLKNGTVISKADHPDLDWGDEGFPTYANNTISCSGTLIIDGATIENKTAPGGASYAVDCYPGANLIVNSGKLDGHGKNAIRMFANSATLPTNVTINGGEIVGTRAIWVQLPSNDANVAPMVNVTVNGGKLISTDSEYNLAIYSYSYGNNFNNTVIALNGGEFYGDVALSGGQKNGAEKLTINQDNCKFYGKVFSYNDEVTIPTVNPTEGYASNDDELTAALKNGNDVVLRPGTYTFPAASNFSSDDTINANGAVFEGSSGLDINGATVIGATFKNDGGVAVTGTINGTFKDCTFTGSNALRWCYAGETVEFENCVFSGSTYGAHFDGGANEVIFKNCTFSGFNAMANEIKKLTLDGCTFVANDESNYNGINLWGSTDLINCTFVFDGSVSYEWVHACAGDQEKPTATYNFTNCVVKTAAGEQLLVETSEFFESRNAENKVTFN